MRKVLCGTPTKNCTGATTTTSAWLGSTQKTHTDSPEAFRCYARYLVSVEGYERIGGREFRKDGEGVLVLTKQSRFGAELRAGKPPVKGASGESKRVMPKSGSGIIF